MATPRFTNANKQRPPHLWLSPRFSRWARLAAHWPQIRFSGAITLLVGIILATGLVLALDRWLIVLPNPGLLYLPLVAMLAYHWKLHYAILATLLELLCVYLFVLPPAAGIKGLTLQSGAQLLVLAAATGFVLGLVQLARSRRAQAEQEAVRIAALHHVSTALAGELYEDRLLFLIAQIACELTGAEFAAFTLRPVDVHGRPLGPAEGSRFRLAAVVGVTREQEALLARMALGGEGLLAPIFRQGVPVRVADALAAAHTFHSSLPPSVGISRRAQARQAAREAAAAYAQGTLEAEHLHALGLPRGHPQMRSFLGAPLLDRDRQVIGGLLLGHHQPDCFTQEDETLLVGLAAQAAVALEHARLYRMAELRAQELDATVERIADGVTLVDEHGTILRDNTAARRLREELERQPAGAQALQSLLHGPARRALSGQTQEAVAVVLQDGQQQRRVYVVTASPLRLPRLTLDPPALNQPALQDNGGKGTPPQRPAETSRGVSGAVVVWHDSTQEEQLLVEQRLRAETEARRALLQRILDELPGSVYLVHGTDARLVLANHAASEVWGASWKAEQPMQHFVQEHGIRIFSPDGRPLPLESLATLRALREGTPVWQHQETIRRPDGSTLPVQVNAVPLQTQNLAPRGSAGIQGLLPTSEPAALVVHLDVSALKEAERLKDEFLGIAAHELRTPLAVLKGYTQMLLLQTARGKGPALADWQQEALESIEQATERLVALTEDLLDVTRLQGGRLALRP